MKYLSLPLESFARLALLAGVWLAVSGAGRAVCLDSQAGWTKVWHEVKQPDYKLVINNIGSGAVLVGKSRFAFPNLAFFAGDKSCSMSSPLHGAGAWTSVTGTVAEADGAVTIAIEGLIEDVKVRQTYRAEPGRVVWDWLAEVIDPTPDMRWFRFQGLFMDCAGYPFAVRLADGGLRRGVLDPAAFRELGQARAIEVFTPKGAATVEWLESSGVTIRPNQNTQQPHIPLTYLCHGAGRAGANSSPPLMPGEQVHIKMQITIKKETKP